MVKTALFVRLEAKPGKEAEVEGFLRGGLPIVEEEPATVAWCLRAPRATAAHREGRCSCGEASLIKASLTGRCRQLRKEFASRLPGRSHE